MFKHGLYQSEWFISADCVIPLDVISYIRLLDYKQKSKEHTYKMVVNSIELTIEYHGETNQYSTRFRDDYKEFIKIGEGSFGYI